MTEITQWDDPFDDVEALVRQAGNYVRPSDDLRPRVLEAARSQHFERSARRRIVQAALLFVMLLVGVSSLNEQAEWPASIAADSPRNASLLQEPTEATRRHDPAWETVEAFRNLRVRQARLFNPPL